MVSKKTDVAEAQSTDVMALTGELPIDVVQSFRTVADIENFFAAQGLRLSYGEEISDGFERLENKELLVGQGFVIIDWNKFWSDQFQQDAYTIRLMTLTGAKYRIADGSTGIMRQLDEITEARLNDQTKAPNAGLIVKEGLRKSEYWVSKTDNRALSSQEAEATPADQKRRAVTFYLNL